MTPIDAITTAVTEPMTRTAFWYGVAFSLAFQKQFRRLIEGTLGAARGAKVQMMGRKE